MELFLHVCRRAQPQLNFFADLAIQMDSFSTEQRKQKVVFVMGATGTGKSRLAIDLATHFPAEIINSDKIQVYKGLDIVTNKVTEEEQRGVPHHLLSEVDPESDFTALDFRHHVAMALDSIIKRQKLPIIAGGSNSYIQVLVDDEDLEFRSKYDCCFLWVDVSPPVLHSYVCKRVDCMVEAGLVDEVREFFDQAGDYSRGIRRAIGVPEMDPLFRSTAEADEEARARRLEQAIDEIKLNTCKLTCGQLEKIHRLRTLSEWNIHRIDATDVFQKRGPEADATWQNLVLRPSIELVQKFLNQNQSQHSAASPVTEISTAAVVATI